MLAAKNSTLIGIEKPKSCVLTRHSQGIRNKKSMEWQMYSCEILTARAEDKLQNMPSNKPERNKTLSKNIRHVQEVRRVANDLNKQVSGLKQRLSKRGGENMRSELSQTEGKLKDAMSEIKLAQDTLRKSIA